MTLTFLCSRKKFLLFLLSSAIAGESGCGGALPFAQRNELVTSSQNAVITPAPIVVSESAPNQSGATCTPDVQIVLSRPGRPRREMPLIFWANPSSITKGQSTTLTWTSGNTTSVSIDHGVGAVPISGSVTVSPTVTTTFTATATGPDGSVTQSVTVGVDYTGFSPTVSAAASPASITNGQPTTLSWSSSNATYVSIDHGIGQVAAQGSLNVSPKANTIYTITAGCAGATVNQQVSVNVQNAKDGITALNHIVFMLLKNRSFDHYFRK